MCCHRLGRGIRQPRWDRAKRGYCGETTSYHRVSAVAFAKSVGPPQYSCSVRLLPDEFLGVSIVCPQSVQTWRGYSSCNMEHADQKIGIHKISDPLTHRETRKMLDSRLTLNPSSLLCAGSRSHQKTI